MPRDSECRADIHCVTVKFVPKILTADHKQQHVDVYKELPHVTSNDATFFSRVIRWWELVLQLRSWNKAAIFSIEKSKLTKWRDAHHLFWHQDDCVKSICPSNQTVNSTFYCDILWQLLENVQRHHPELWSQKLAVASWQKHHLTLPWSPQNCWPKTTWLSSTPTLLA